MSIARLAVMCALAAVIPAAFAPSAPAQEEPVEVVEENGAHCPDIAGTGAEATGGCPVTGQGEVTLVSHVFGIEFTVSDCIVEGSGIIDEEGEGWVQQGATLDHPGQDDCSLEACPETGHDMRAWPVHVREDASQLIGETEFCMGDEPSGGNPKVCLVTRAINSVGHSFSESEVDVPGTNHSGAPGCELTGSGQIAAGQIEIEHDHLP